jgi:protocatechuate 3,4-dioxygenase beta subunit
MLRLAAFVVGASFVAGLAAQSPATPPRGAAAPAATGILVGRVLDATADTPIANVIVAISGAPLPRAINVLTDAQGRFLFRSVPKGTFTLRATIGGNGYAPSGFMVTGGGLQIGPYLSGGFGQRRPGGLLQALDVDDAARISDVVIKLWKGGSIDGTVIDEAGEPLVNVVVAAAKRSTDGRLLNGPSTRTDDRGAYHLGTMVPGNYVIVVPHMQAAMPTATSEILAAPPDRLISSRLANSGAAGFAGGIRVGNSAISTTTGLNTSTIVPSPRGDAHYIYQTTFAPAATSLDQASSVTINPGEERTGVNISMQPVRAVAVSGTLTDDLGPIPQFGVRLLPREAEDGSGLFDVATTSTDARGRFTFPLVPPGSYRVIAQRLATTLFTDGPEAAVQPSRIADRAGTSARQEITVGDRDLTDVALQLGIGVQVSGRVEFRGTGNRPSADQLRQFNVAIELVQPPSRSFFNVGRSGRIGAGGEFAIRDTPPGRYVTFTTDIPGWTVLSVTIGGRLVTERSFTVETTDVTDMTVEFTDQPAEITGTVRTRAGAPDADAGVLIFSTDRTRWGDAQFARRTFRAGRASKAGAFSLPAVLPGEYFIVAVPDEATADFPDAKFMETLAPLATKITIAAGNKQSVSLTTSSVPPAKPPVSDLYAVRPVAIAPIAHGPFVPETADGNVVQAAPVSQTAVMLAGVVTTDETPAQPLRHAIVTATGAEIIGSRQVVTDDEGRFAFPDLPPGRYSITAEKAGYVKTYYGSKRPGRPPGTPVAMLAGQPAPNVVIRVLRGAVIAGTVRDQFGAPVASSQVTVKQPIVINGQRRMIDVPNLLVPNATTDDRGRYRIYGLPPGEYTVYSGGGGPSYSGVRETNVVDVEAALREMKGVGAPAKPSPPPEPRQVSMHAGYLPGVPDVASAQLLTLAAGEERTGADIVTRLVRSMRVEGMAIGPGGAPMQNVSIAIVNAGEGTLWSSPGMVRPGADGRFVLPPLTPGHYALIGRAGENGADETETLRTGMLYSGQVEFFLNDQDLSGIVLPFERGVSVSGRIVPPAGATPADLSRIRLGMKAADTRASFAPGPPTAVIQPNGTVRFDGIGPGTWRVTGTLPAGWSLRSAIVNGRDTLDAPLEVRSGQPVSDLVLTLTDRPAELTGTLSDATGRPTSAYSMLAFSTDRSLWTVPRRVSGAVRLSSDGRYRIVGLPPGEYYVTAIIDFDPLQLGDASFLESLVSASAKVTLGEGERKEFNLRTGGG